MIDNSMFNAAADLHTYFCVLLRADPILAGAAEAVILELEDLREVVHQIYQAAWYDDHEQFDTIGEAARLCAKDRVSLKGESEICRVYSKLWDRSANESLRLLEKRAAALQKQSGSLRSRRRVYQRLKSQESTDRSPEPPK
jgi:hypothetical protein